MARAVVRPVASRAILAAAALLLLATPAAAHSDLDSSIPEDGAQLAEAPEWVMLHFSGPIEPSASSITVVDEAGQRVDLDDLRTTSADRSPMLNISLRPDLPDGGYLVAWKILSDDGHPNSGEFGFAVGNTTPPPAGAEAAERLHASSVPGRILAYAGLALAFGAAVWLWAVRSGVEGLVRPAGRLLLVGAALHAAGALWLFQDTIDTTGLPAGVLAASQVGRMLLLRVVAGLVALVLAGLAIVPGNPSRLGTPAAIAFLAIAAGAAASVGHAAGEGLPARALDAMHLVASTTWVGGLVFLGVVLKRASRAGADAAALRHIGLRFGTVALVCVGVLLLTGVGTTLYVLGRAALLDPLHLLESGYGRLLLAKVLAALLMLALAAANRFVFLDPRHETGVKAAVASVGPDGTGAGLRRTVWVEAVVGLAVLVLAGFLTATSPTDHEAAPAHDHSAVAADAHAGHGLPDAAAAPAAALISGPWHGSAMMLLSAFAPLHEGHDGGGLFDAYNVTIGLVVLAILGVVGFVLYKVAKRRRGE